MPTFKIKTVDNTGAPHEETMEAADQSAVQNVIKQRGDTLVMADEVSKKAKKGILNIELNFLSRVKTHEKITFARNLGSMIDAGLSLSRALTVIEKQTKQKKFKNIVINVGKSISQGKTLHEAMKEYPEAFPALMTAMVQAGEESGSLAQSLRVVATQMENSYALTRKVRGALMYPSIILLVMCVIGFFMMTFVVPVLADTFNQLKVQLPIQTRLILATSSFLKNHFILAIVIILAFAAGVYLSLRTKAGNRFLDWLILHIPVIGMIAKEVNSARTARTMSSLLSSGVDVVVATKITADVLQNSYYKEVLRVVGEKIQKGEPIAAVFNANEHLYPIFVGEMISVGEETGQLAQMLLGVAVFYETDVDQKTKDMSSIIEPVLMVVIGLAVGFFAVSIISPIYSLSSSI